MDISLLNKKLEHNGINVLSFKINGKEHYVQVIFTSKDFSFETMIPIVYRRSFLNLSTEEEVARYLISIKKYFEEETVKEWFENELKTIKNKVGIKYTFLKVLLQSKGKRLLSSDFPQNPNSQKIIQGWRDYGYIISTIHGSKETNRETPHWIVPLPKIQETLYETMSPSFVEKVLKFLGDINVYEARKTSGNLPDHKFSEVRWDIDTPEKNSIEITKEEAKAKFQILDTQRNQQKREVCRHCFETGIRGTIYGIKYYYKGTDKWDPTIPTTGKQAELGCVGCPWYDIQKWREELQKMIDCHTK